MAASAKDIEAVALEFTEGDGQILNLAVFYILGLFSEIFLAEFSWMVLLYAVLSLTVIRMLPVSLSSSEPGSAGHRSGHGLVRAAGLGIGRAPAHHLRR